MITEKELDGLAAFGKEEDGSYCDRWQFSIRQDDNRTIFSLFSEVDGSTWFIKYLKDLDDLKNVYHAITDKELEFSEIEYEYEMFFKSEPNDVVIMDGWIPIETSQIKNKDKIPMHIKTGLLRKIK